MNHQGAHRTKDHRRAVAVCGEQFKFIAKNVFFDIIKNPSDGNSELECVHSRILLAEKVRIMT